MIYEAQEWLKDQRPPSDLSQIKDLRYAIYTDHVQVQGWDGSRFKIGTGSSLERAFAHLRAQLPTPESSILRAAAAEMIERAEKMEAQ
jgi:hypothetical protein